MRALIKHYTVDAEFFTDEGCYITELSNSSDDPDVSIARARVQPGTTTRLHRLKETVERYCIISGEGHVELDGQSPQQVKVGDTVLIPAMCSQRITNTGDEDLVFLAICTPRFTDDAYQDIEDSF